MRFTAISLTILVGYTVLGASNAEAANNMSTLENNLFVAMATPKVNNSISVLPTLPTVSEPKVVSKTFTANLSAYTAAADECGKSDGITASGKKVTAKRTLACPKNYKFGTKIYIEGMGEYSCEDRGGAIKGNKFDIYVETKKEAFAFGRRNLEVSVIQ